MLLEPTNCVGSLYRIVLSILQDNKRFVLGFLFVQYFKENKSNTKILVWRVEKTEKIDFTLGFCYLNAIFLRGKKDSEENIDELGDR